MTLTVKNGYTSQLTITPADSEPITVAAGDEINIEASTLSGADVQAAPEETPAPAPADDVPLAGQEVVPGA